MLVFSRAINYFLVRLPSNCCHISDFRSAPFNNEFIKHLDARSRKTNTLLVLGFG